MIITHRCPSCGDFAVAPGTCGFCDLAFRELAAEGTQTPPCPDWPDDEPDQRERRTTRRRPAPRPRTRRAAAV